MNDTILGIETYCDETAAAVVRGGSEILSDVVASQIELHAKYGGVVPEIASRAHIEWLDQTVAEALDRAGTSPRDIDGVAVSHVPGLVGCLLIGLTAAKTLAWAWQKPLLAVNHIHAHVAAARIRKPDIRWPAVALIVSGGHTSLFLVENLERLTPLGHTTDDAAGEAGDKVASILGLGYPGGPAIDRVAAGGDPTAIKFPRTMLGRDSLDFSFSGLKTAVLYHVHGKGKTTGGLEKLSEREIADIAASFQAAVVDVLVAKTLRAAKTHSVPTIVIGGGVAANSVLRRRMTEAAAETEHELVIPPMRYCTDNAVMVAVMGHSHYQSGRFAPLDTPAVSRPIRAPY